MSTPSATRLVHRSVHRGLKNSAGGGKGLEALSAPNPLYCNLLPTVCKEMKGQGDDLENRRAQALQGSSPWPSVRVHDDGHDQPLSMCSGVATPLGLYLSRGRCLCEEAIQSPSWTRQGQLQRPPAAPPARRVARSNALEVPGSARIAIPCAARTLRSTATPARSRAPQSPVPNP